MHRELQTLDLQNRMYNVLYYFERNGYKEHFHKMLKDYNALKDTQREVLGTFVEQYEGLAKRMEEQQGDKKESKEPDTR